MHAAPRARMLDLQPIQIPVIGSFIHEKLGPFGDVINFFLPIAIVAQLGALKDMGKRTARASHVLVPPERYGELLAAKAKIEARGPAFGGAARGLSTCPTAKRGADFSEFNTGKMVREFDAAVFDDSKPIGELQMVRTQFGWHLVSVASRST